MAWLIRSSGARAGSHLVQAGDLEGWNPFDGLEVCLELAQVYLTQPVAQALDGIERRHVATRDVWAAVSLSMTAW